MSDEGTVVVGVSEKPVASTPLNHSEVPQSSSSSGSSRGSCVTALQQLLRNGAENLTGKKTLFIFCFSLNSLESETRGDVCGPSGVSHVCSADGKRGDEIGEQ